MDLIRVPETGVPVIQAYGDHGFRISGERIEGAVLVHSRGVVRLALTSFAEIGESDVAPLAALDQVPEILLVGAGTGPEALPSPARTFLDAARISVEVMGTGAACRTYNVLAGEERRVAALLLPVA